MILAAGMAHVKPLVVTIVPKAVWWAEPSLWVSVVSALVAITVGGWAMWSGRRTERLLEAQAKSTQRLAEHTATLGELLSSLQSWLESMERTRRQRLVLEIERQLTILRDLHDSLNRNPTGFWLAPWSWYADELARAVKDASTEVDLGDKPHRALDEVHSWLEDMARSALQGEDVPGGAWPNYGSPFFARLGVAEKAVQTLKENEGGRTGG